MYKLYNAEGALARQKGGEYFLGKLDNILLASTESQRGISDVWYKA